MTLQSQTLYQSPSGDRWQLVRDPAVGRVFVRHEANLASGGRVSEIEIGAFLSAGMGPEQQGLLRLLGEQEASILSREGRATSATPPTWDDMLGEVKTAISTTLTDEDFQVFIDRPDNDRLHEAAVAVLQALRRAGALRI